MSLNCQVSEKLFDRDQITLQKQRVSSICIFFIGLHLFPNSVCMLRENTCTDLGEGVGGGGACAGIAGWGICVHDAVELFVQTAFSMDLIQHLLLLSLCPLFYCLPLCFSPARQYFAILHCSK